ncbi:unnamed protein product [Caenorhabditis bovis]|uniref:Uncharacterized protein n=1 Tax=Caenorhabditis bovis TaxID=2654633 RepID=A0A8S1ES13_9PELO|nr:unnamed protein product [Caenorhabditis bovis]
MPILFARIICMHTSANIHHDLVRDILSTPIGKPVNSRLHQLQAAEMGNHVSTPGPIKDLINKFDQLELCSSSKSEKEGIENEIQPHSFVINQQPDFDDDLTKKPPVVEEHIDKEIINEKKSLDSVDSDAHSEALKVSLDAESDSGISGSANFSPDASSKKVDSKTVEVLPTSGEEFRELHDRVKEELQKKMDEASVDLENVEKLPEKCADSLRAAHGNAHLLVRKKFGVFSGLIEKNLNPVDDDPKPVNFTDLEAFWVTIDMELAGIRKEFEKVEKYRAAGWDENAVTEEEEPKKEVVAQKARAGPAVPKKVSTVSAETKEKLEKQRAAAEQRRQEMRAQMKKKMMEMKQEKQEIEQS